MPIVRRAGPGEVPALSAALTEAFAGEPVTEWMLPQRSRRRARRELMFALDLDIYVLPNGGLVTTADDDRGALVGGCLTLPPSSEMPSSVNGRTALRLVRAYGFKLTQTLRMQRAMAARHPGEDHYYVRWVGIRPALRGQGLGSALMRPALDRCDADGIAAYLEASTERSAALYGRLGFVHQGALDLPDGGPRVWPMRRPPGG